MLGPTALVWLIPLGEQNLCSSGNILLLLARDLQLYCFLVHALGRPQRSAALLSHLCVVLNSHEVRFPPPWGCFPVAH